MMSDDQACKAIDPRPMTADEVDHQWRNWCVIEVMVRNPAVNERIGYLERENAALRQKLTEARRAERERCAKEAELMASHHRESKKRLSAEPAYRLEFSACVLERLADNLRALPDEETK